MTKARVQDPFIDFNMVTLVAQTHYTDWCEYIGSTDITPWDELPQEARDYYIRKALETFGVELKDVH